MLAISQRKNCLQAFLSEIRQSFFLASVVRLLYDVRDEKILRSIYMGKEGINVGTNDPAPISLYAGAVSSSSIYPRWLVQQCRRVWTDNIYLTLRYKYPKEDSSGTWTLQHTPHQQMQERMPVSILSFTGMNRATQVLY